MQLTTKKKTAAAAIAMVLLISSVMLIASTPVEAQLATEQQALSPPSGVTPYWTTETEAFLSVRPKTSGLGQAILVNTWIGPALGPGRYFLSYSLTGSYRLTFTKPDGSTDVITLSDTRADTTSYLDYVVDAVGEWKVRFDFLGTYFPEGRVQNGWMVANTSGTYYPSAYYKPSSAEYTFYVQQEIVPSWPELPLPNDYWTRPLLAVLNREWWPMAGNYPNDDYSPLSNDPRWIAMWNTLYPGCNPYSSDRYTFHPWVKGPYTCHIVWSRQDAVAGWIGPNRGLSVSGTATNPTVIFAGRAYATQTVRWYNGSLLSCAVCYDLRTGEMYYMIPTAAPFNGITPSIIEYTTNNAELISVSGGYLRKINPWTGALTTNVSIGSLGGSHYMNQHYIQVQDLGAAAGAERYRLINWTTAGTSTNWATRIVSNTTYARSSLPTTIDYNVGIGVESVSGESTTNTTTGVYMLNPTLHGYNLKTGVEIWSNYLGSAAQWYSPSCYICDHGKWAGSTQKGTWYCVDITTGKFLWESPRMDYPWDRVGFGAYSVSSAYGMIIKYAYGGVYAFNWTDGSIVWKYKAFAYAPFESPYVDENGVEVYSFNTGGKIADGMLWTYNTEHTPTSPATRGWGIHCINMTTGEGIWRFSVPMTAGAIADGYMTVTASSMGTMYVIGKGQSATTVTAEPAVIAEGATVLIKGTLLDMSPAQSGTPCVAKESMQLQMEYLHMQRPIGGLWGNETVTGVPVSLLAMAEDGSYIDIGTVTTNGYYGTFSKAWTPPKEDTYTIIATFAGDDSYGSSSAATAVTVGPAPATPSPTPEPPEAAPDNTPLMYGILLGVIAAIIIGLIALFRKR